MNETNLVEEIKQYFNKPGDESLERLIKASTPLIVHFASRLSGGRYDQDMIQTGYEGVLKALKTYSADKGASFITYAGHFIMGEIRHYIRRESRYYRPRFISEMQDKAQHYIQNYYENNGEIPSDEKLSRVLNIHKQGVEEVLRAGLVSMDEIDLDKINSLHYESFKLPIEDRIHLYESIRRLSLIKQKLIVCLFFKNYTQQQTADYLGINQRKVSRLLKSSIDDLKALILE